MHLSTFFLRLLAPALTSALRGAEVAACFSQEKDELVLGFADYAGKRESWLRAVLTGAPTALGFPAEYRRARQNSVDLFPELLTAGPVADVRAEFGERSLWLRFDGGSRLIFKLFGARANVVWFPEAGSAARPVLFRRKLTEDADLREPAPDAPAAEVIVEALPAPATAATLPRYYGDVPTRWLRERGYDTAAPAEQARLWTALNGLLLAPEAFYLTEITGKLRLSLLPVGAVEATFPADAPLVAAEEFLRRFRSTTAFADLYARAHRYLTRQQESALRAAGEVETRLRALETDASYRQTADLIMAHLTQIPKGATEVEVLDFYTGQPRRIKLKRDLSPQRVAENLYRKAKNQVREVQELRERLARYETSALRALDLLPTLEAQAPAAVFKDLRNWLRTTGLLDELQQTKAEAALPATPFKEFESQGFRILVGRSAANNDELTLRHARKDDLWLHAKDVPGSHVVIRQVAGQTIPRPVIEQAAALAAWYSKRKSDTLCPVIVTPRKYVRKVRGAAAGSVRVEREQQVVLVRPANPFERG